MSFSTGMQAHRRSLLFFFAVAILGGAGASFLLPVGLFPRVDFPRVRVSLDAGDRPADRMAIEVTLPAEEAVRGVPGVREVRSNTSRGSADVDVTFGWGQDMIARMLEVESALSQAALSMPAGTSYTVLRMDPTVFPVLAYSLTSTTHSLTELRDLALYQLRPILSTVKGVAKIEVQGGLKEEVQVVVDPARLADFGVSLTDVATTLAAGNVLEAVGKLEDRYKLFLVMSSNAQKGAEDVAATVLRAGPGGGVRVRDVASVVQGTAPNWARVTADGKDAVLLLVYQQQDGNTVEIARQSKELLRTYAPQLPRDVRLSAWYDQGELILSSAASVRDAVLIGAGLAALVILLFLRNGRITLLAAATVPATLAMTVLVLALLHKSFNIMTLGGMAAAVGLIIDDAIVMVEHIMRRVRSGGGTFHGRVMRGAFEFTRPLAGSSAATIVIFAPLAFLSGVTGAFFKALSLTMAVSLLLSFFLSWVAVPLLADRFLTERDAEQEDTGFLTERFRGFYERVMDRVLGRPGVVLLALVPLLALGILGRLSVGSGFMPSMDEGGFILDYVAPAGTSVTETDRLLRQVEAILRATPEVTTYSRRTGLQLGGGVTEANTGDFFVRLKEGSRRPIDEIMDDVRSRVESRVPGLEIEMAQLMEDLIGDLTAVPQPVEIKLFHDDEAVLSQLAPRVAQAVQGVRGLVDVKSGIVYAGDALEIKVDPAAAALEGMDPDAVSRLVQAAVEGDVATSFQKGPKMVDVRVWAPPAQRRSILALQSLQLRAADGHLVPLSRIARLVTTTGQQEIERDDLKRMVAVTGRITGRDLGSAVREVKRVLTRPGLIGNGVYVTLGGLYQQQQIAFRGLLAVFAAAAAILFCLLLFLFESFRLALAVILTTLFSLTGVFIGLWITGTELNISSMMGMTMILGIVTEVAIFYVTEFMAHDPQGPLRPALIRAGQYRARPIIMTTVAAVLALAPLALGLGQGAAMERPLAVTIISGMALQIPLSLVVLPALLVLLKVRRSA